MRAVAVIAADTGDPDSASVAVTLNLQIASAELDIPAPAFFVNCIARTLHTRRARAELTIRIVDEEEARALNQRWRDRDYATNVLSFPLTGLAHIAPDLLGDIVLCAPVIAAEAATQGKTRDAHWAHLTVHGVLHLLGFDHEHAAAAAAMERHERAILAALGLPDPYRAEPPA